MKPVAAHVRPIINQAFADHENVVTLLNVIKAKNDKDIYLVFEHMDTDLHMTIKGKVLQQQPVWMKAHTQFILRQGRWL